MDEDLKKKFMDFCNCPEDEAVRFLEIAENDVDKAIDLYFASGQSLKAPEKDTGVKTLFNKDAPPKEEEGQAFYVGGSERGGGQQVIGPKKDKKEFISDIFSAAKEHGADVLDKERYEKASGSNFRAFSGNAFVLGENLSAPSQSKAAQLDSDQEEQEEEFIVKLWSDGFSLNDGPLRTFEDPSSIEFLTSIRSGRIPLELISKAGNKKVNLLLEDHKEEAYQPPPKPKLKPFSGSGNVLGHPTTQFKESVLSQPHNVQGNVPKVDVDDSKPKTKIQVKLISGGRMVLELNEDHTVASIKQEIMHREPGYQSVNFGIFSAHPVKQLNEEDTLKDANLINAVVIQKPC